MLNQFTGTTKTGERCKAKALPGSEFCVTHDPTRVVELAEWRRAGGRAKSNKARMRKALPDDVMTSVELQGVISKALRDVLAGDLEPGRANAAAALTRALTAVAETAGIEERLAALERASGLGGRNLA